MSESTAAAAGMANSSLDFVYLDARHDFMGVVADIQAWWPKVKVGGVFAGHVRHASLSKICFDPSCPSRLFEV